MAIKRYEDMGDLELDIFREIGSIGIGNAATALSQVLNTKVRMKLPKVSIVGFDEAVSSMGDPEEIVMAVLVQVSGKINGMMLYMLHLDFVNAILSRLVGKYVTDYTEIDEMSVSAIEESGNIIISSYINAITKLAGIDVSLSVPSTAISMRGAIMSVPMAEFGYVTDKLLLIEGEFLIGDKQLEGNLMLLPDVESLNYLMEKLGVTDING